MRRLAEDVVVSMSKEEAAELRNLLLEHRDEFEHVDPKEAYQAFKP